MEPPTLPPNVVQAAHNGEADAQCELAIWHARQDGPDHAAQAKDWLLRAHAQGNSRAAYNLGVLLRDSDQQAALRYLEESASADYTLAQRAIGYMLWDNGDWKGALPWLGKAAVRRDAASEYAVAKIILDAEEPELYGTAVKAASLAAEAGFVDAQALLATIFHEGLGVDRSPPDAAYWWQRAAFNGHAGAQCSLGTSHHLGIAVPKDIVQAAQWIIRSCRQGNELAIAYWDRLSAELTDRQYEDAMDLARRPLSPADSPQ